MSEFKKKDKNSFWYSPLSIIVLFCLLIFSIYKVINLIKIEKETSDKKEKVLDKIDDLEKRKLDLNEEITKMNTEQGIEEAIRDKFNVIKEGEKVLVIVDEKEEDLLKKDTRVDHSFWGWLKGLFSGN